MAVFRDCNGVSNGSPLPKVVVVVVVVAVVAPP